MKFIVFLSFLSLPLFVNAIDDTCQAGPAGTCTSSDGSIVSQDGSVILSENDLYPPEGTIDVIVPKFANTDGTPRAAVKDCLDRHDECIGFEERGECDINPGWMIINCPKSCDKHNNACTLRDPKLRCTRTALGINTEPVYKPGDMNDMFSSIKTR